MDPTKTPSSKNGSCEYDEGNPDPARSSESDEGNQEPPLRSESDESIQDRAPSSESDEGHLDGARSSESDEGHQERVRALNTRVNALLQETERLQGRNAELVAENKNLSVRLEQFESRDRRRDNNLEPRLKQLEEGIEKLGIHFKELEDFYGESLKTLIEYAERNAVSDEVKATLRFLPLTV